MKPNAFSLITDMHGIPSILLHNQSGLDGSAFFPSELQLLSFCVGALFVEVLRYGEESLVALVLIFE